MTKPADDELTASFSEILAKLQGDEGRELKARIKHLTDTVKDTVLAVQEQMTGTPRAQPAPQVAADPPAAPVLTASDLAQIAGVLRGFVDALVPPSTATAPPAEPKAKPVRKHARKRPDRAARFNRDVRRHKKP